MDSNKETERLTVIDGLKAIAMIMVVFHHTLYSSFWAASGSEMVIRFGFLGVNFFFMLSGFVLFMPYVQNNRAFTSRRDIGRFYARRLWRLYPLYFIVILFALIVVRHLEREAVISAGYALSGLGQFTGRYFYPTVSQALWYVPVYIMFVLAFPWVVKCIKRFGIINIAILAFVMSFCVRLIAVRYFIQSEYFYAVRNSAFARFDDFFAGMLLCYLVVLHGWHRYAKSRYLVAGGVFFILSNQFRMMFMANFTRLGYEALMANMAQLAFACLLLCALHESSRLHGWLQFPAFAAIGRSSYSIYLWHVPLITLFLPTVTVWHFSVYLLVLAVATVISHNADSAFHRYVRARKLRLNTKRTLQ